MTAFDSTPLWQSVGVISGVNGLGFVISLLTGSHLHLDLLGTGAFALAAATPLFVGITKASALLRVKTSCAAVMLWGTKLAGFLFFRALRVKHDARLDGTLSTVSGTVGFWVLSLLWGVLCSLPHALGTTSDNPGLTSTTVVGTTMFAIGFIIETVADLQKWSFKNSAAAAPDQFCNVGLWSVSQHPNYFGNFLLWTGILILNAPALIEMPGEKAKLLQNIWGARRLFLALLSPLFMWALFYGQANGTVTNAVEAAMTRYGNNPDYADYVENVPLIVPRLFGKRSS